MTKIASTLGKVLLVAAAALFGQSVLGGLLIAILGPVWPEPVNSEAVIPLLALAQLLLVLALWGPTRFSRLPKRSLFWALFSAIFGLGVFLTQIEAAVFLVMTTDQLLFGCISGTLHALWLAWLMATFFGPDPADGAAERSITDSVAWRHLATGSIAYLVLYFVGGMMIYAQIEDYYATQHIPPLPWLIALQLVRGALYVLFVLGLLRSSTLGRGLTALGMALMFPMLAGVASLLVPNAVMPEAVRLWHMLEIGVTNFIFGALVGYLFWPGTATEDSPLPKRELVESQDRRPDQLGLAGR